jgi:hypothetical protein
MTEPESPLSPNTIDCGKSARTWIWFFSVRNVLGGVPTGGRRGNSRDRDQSGRQQRSLHRVFGGDDFGRNVHTDPLAPDKW